MKKIIILILLLTSIISIGQNKEYRKAVNLFNGKQYAEANVIVEKLLNKEFGDLDEEKEFYCLQMNTNCYSLLNDFTSAYSKAKMYLEFIKNSSKGFLVNKETAVDGAEKLIEELKLKIPQDSNSTIETMIASTSSSTTKTDSSETKVAETTKPVSDDKTVTLTVSGTGKTLEEAKLNALRSAIEQAFGTFISSKTEILNDNLVKDEIVSVSSGNVEKYDLISQVEIPNTGFVVILSVIVSISKLTSFAQSKGVAVEFEGGMFGMKIKLQELNEKNELNACINILSVVHELLQIGYDYVLETGEPKRFNDTQYYFEFKVSGKPNPNFHKAMNYLKSSLTNLQMSPNEILEYEKLNKGNYDFRGFHLRNVYSFQTLKNIDYYANYYAGNFNLIINNQKKISGPDLGGHFNSYNWQSGLETFTFPSFMFDHQYSDDDDQFYFTGYINDKYRGNAKRYPKPFLTEDSFNFQWQQLFDIGEIEKINSISVVGKGVNSIIKLGGFVIFEDENKYIIASPYSLYWNGFEEVNDVEINTSKKMFEGKSNMNLLKNNQQFSKLFKMVLNHNLKNNTDWHVPSEEELKLYIKEVASTHSRINDNSYTYYSSTISYKYSTEMFCFDMRNNSKSDFLFNENQYYGIPFNSHDSFKLLEMYFYNNRSIDINTRNGDPVIPLVKYVNK